MKLKAKFIQPQTFLGTVGSTTIKMPGRNKREATRRLRKAFANQGMPTQPNPMTDLLTVIKDDDRSHHLGDDRPINPSRDSRMKAAFDRGASPEEVQEAWDGNEKPKHPGPLTPIGDKTRTSEKRKGPSVAKTRPLPSNRKEPTTPKNRVTTKAPKGEKP